MVSVDIGKRDKKAEGRGKGRWGSQRQEKKGDCRVDTEAKRPNCTHVRDHA